MIETKEKTAIETSVCADERQSVQNTIDIIPTLDTEINHQFENSALKAKIQSLTTELSAVKAELKQYKSVRAKLRTPDLEQENDRLRKRIRIYEEVISKNNLWHFFKESRSWDDTR